jgi:allene oxide cyclase
MSRRWVVGISGSALLVLAVGSTSLAFAGSQRTTSTAQRNAHVFTVVERAVTDAVVDLGPAGDSVGDSLAWANQLYNAGNRNVIGSDQGSCVRTVVGAAWECSWTNILARGHITVQGPFYDDGSDSTLAITGGTGAYRDASGQMILHFRNAAGTAFDFEFHLGD